MQRAVIALAAVVPLVAVAAFSLSPSRATAQDEPATYVGAETCKECHYQEHKAWKGTGLAKSLDALRPTTEESNAKLFAKKTKAELDPAKDYTTDATCLKCHTTGYGLPGGYPEDPAASDEAKARAAELGSVSCEACHGPGSRVVAFKKAETAKDKDAKFTFEQMAPYGLIHPNEDNCAVCHNADNPTNADATFVFDAEKKKPHPEKEKRKKKRKKKKKD